MKKEEKKKWFYAGMEIAWGFLVVRVVASVVIFVTSSLVLLIEDGRVDICDLFTADSLVVSRLKKCMNN